MNRRIKEFVVGLYEQVSLWLTRKWSWKREWKCQPDNGKYTISGLLSSNVSFKAANTYINIFSYSFILIDNSLARSLDETIGCPTLYPNRHFFNNFTTGWWIAAPFRKNLAHYRHTLQTYSSSFVTQRTYSCSNFVAISSMPGSVASGTPCVLCIFGLIAITN